MITKYGKMVMLFAIGYVAYRVTVGGMSKPAGPDAGYEAGNPASPLGDGMFT